MSRGDTESGGTVASPKDEDADGLIILRALGRRWKLKVQNGV